MKKKKVGIITLQGEDNFGNILQNYAVQTVIESYGYQVCTLDNQTKQGFFITMEKEYPFVKKLKISYILNYIKEKLNFQNVKDLNPVLFFINYKKSIIAKQLESIRHKKFNECKIKYNHYTDTSVNAKWFCKSDYDEYFALVTGSDQVWNPYYASVSGVNFLRFVPEHKRIAFAVSFGVDHIPDKRKEIYRKWIFEIPSISVREKSGAEIIKKLTGKDVEILLDPTFALSRQEWLEYAGILQVNVKRSSYILLYFLGNKTIEYTRWIKRYAKKFKLEIVSIHDMHEPEYYTVDPTEFIWLIANAAIVFTDSFHGIALAINLNIPFVAFERNEIGQSMSTRIDSLLNVFGLQSRKFLHLKRKSVLEEINFEPINAKIEMEREKIYSYINNSLNKVETVERFPLLAEGSHCIGCLSCYNKCNVTAIRLFEDSDGFLYPKVDRNKCQHCMACQTVCPQDGLKISKNYVSAYYATAKDRQILNTSSSGGVFYYLAISILDKGGWVYGAKYSENYDTLYHVGTNNIKKIEQLQTSKYLQSNTDGIFIDVENKLKQGIPVLFSGTPCQIGALQKYLGKQYENLFLLDFICHGVPSPMVWKRYVNELSNGRKIKDVNFRDKRNGWRNCGLKIKWEDGEEYYKTLDQEPYFRVFLNDLSLRPSCYECQYKGNYRDSDLTIADYWGISAVQNEKDNLMGVSLVIIRSEKGKCLFEDIADKYMIFGKTDAEDALNYNESAYKCPEYKVKRDIFFNMIQNNESISKAGKILTKKVF